ncbi:COG4223 family protein [Palleronia caenipelagi]|uniref:Mitochondrial inner membrane protein n=1 Tax=Palleronia caenipelagi TaxID=2489174 RepID=A0A547Q841_9RHOB|nr:hypothetical protein [Palleronia caenipelagi]TRD22552.1 hypothetical protein FEV53_03815 [Palleronia caenipelagi]
MSETDTNPGADTEPKDETATDLVVTSPEPSRSPSGRGSFVATLLGGVVAGGIGYVAAYYTDFSLLNSGEGEDPLASVQAEVEAQSERLDQFAADTGARIDALETAEAPIADASNFEELIGAVAVRVDELMSRVDGLPADLPELPEIDFSPLEERLANLEGSDLKGITEALAVRLATLEGSDATQKLQDTVSKLSARIDELSALTQDQSEKLAEQAALIDEQKQTLAQQETAIADAESAARAEANRISVQAALADIRAAMEIGDPYADAIGALQSASGADVPEALSAPAADGVATMAALQASYPAVARQALSASVAETAGDRVQDRLGAFLKAQAGVRSLSEKEGDDPDAVLSRAEARLAESDLEGTLAEIAKLSPAGQETFSDWTSRAQARLDARSALAGMSDTVSNQ